MSLLWVWGGVEATAKEAAVVHTAVPKYTFLISLDGWAYRHLWDKKLSMPNLRKLAKKGRWGDSRTTFPSMTWSSHASLVTGQTPAKHGILGNRWFRDFKTIMIPSWDVVEETRKSATIYDLAFDAELRPAAIMWPGTQGSQSIYYNLPELTKKWLIRKHISRRMWKVLRKVSVRSLSRLHYLMRQEGDRTDRLAAKVTIELIRQEKKRPRLFMVHFLGLDHAQHSMGTDPKRNKKLRRSARRIDKHIGDIVAATKRAGIFHQSTFVLVSDHGFIEAKYSIDPRRLLMKAGLSRYHSVNSRRASKEDVFVTRNGHTAFVYIRKDRGKRRYWKLRQRAIRVFRNCKHVEKIFTPVSYAKLGFPTPAQHLGSPDFIAMTKPDSFFNYHSSKAAVFRVKNLAFHGYLPSHKDLWTSFVAFGAGIQPSKKRESIRNIDIAPTLATLLRLRWPKETQGRSLKGWFRQDTLRALKRASEAIQGTPLSAKKTGTEEKTGTSSGDEKKNVGG